MEGFKKSLLACIWFMFLTFPLVVIRVDTAEKTVQWRWMHMLWVGLGAFLLSYVWRFMLKRKAMGRSATNPDGTPVVPFLQRLSANPPLARSIMAVIAIGALVFPWLFSTYQTNIMISAMIYIVLGLGLNIVVGLSGQLVLGYAAFYAAGAYSYALLNHHFGLGFWTALPLGAGAAALCGIILGIPVLRLRGDYLAIVTLGFGEIVRLVLENWNEFSMGPSGVSGISRPGLFSVELSVDGATTYIYYLMIGLVALTIFVINRLKNSRIGRAWLALREDEIACVAMGVDRMKTKLTAFALGATWAGMAGVVFAAKTTFINPASFTFMESAMILAIVVLGGMGSILGVSLAALLILLLPEYLRAFSEYRMLLFGATMVLFMVFRPQGLVSSERQRYEFKETKESQG